MENQLLSLVVLNEEPHLEHERKLLLETMAQDLRSLRDYEDRTLVMLTESEQHLLDRHDLVENLKRSKLTSDEISERVRENETNERQINLARQCYVSLAKRGSLLYFLLNDLSRLNMMYQFSLTWFQRTFLSCILDRNATGRMSMTNIAIESDSYQRAARQRRRSSMLTSFLNSPNQSFSEDSSVDQSSSRTRSNVKSLISTINPQQRAIALSKMVDRLTFTIYQLVSWSLFAEHQLLFSFLLCSTIEREEIQDDTFELQEHTDTNQKSTMISKDDWTCFMSPLLTTTTKENLKFINEKLPKLYPICCALLDEEKQDFLTHSNPYFYLSEDEKTKYLPSFSWVLLIKLLRPEFLLPAISQYVSDRMGQKFLSSGFADIQDIYAHSSPQAPIILLLSPGRTRSSI